jgi:hypothetical protein
MCSIEACASPVIARGLCDTHYRRWKRHGSTAERPRRERQPCSVDDCEGLTEAKGLCHLHYMRYRRTGTSSDSVRETVCSIEECESPVNSRGWCRLHYGRWQRTGSPDTAPQLRPNWQGDSVGYSGLHTRIRKNRGKAASYECEHCSSTATEWAYDHRDPDECHDDRSGLAYSLKPEHYMPLCKSCHVRLDAENRVLMGLTA